MKKILLTITVFLLMQLRANAQQDPVYTQYLFNPFVYNPAYITAYNMANATAVSRMQWLNTNPYYNSTNNFSLQTTLPETDRMGIGMMVQKDVFGINSNIDVRLAGSYKLKLNDYTSLSFG